MIESLADRVWGNASFHEEAKRLKLAFLQGEYIGEQVLKLTDDEMSRLARAATILSASSKAEHKEEAYQIATAAVELNGNSLDGLRHVLLVVLNRLGNFPAIGYAESRFKITEYQLPIRVAVESAERRAGNSIRSAEETLVLTDFQYSLWRELQQNEAVSISAPTSAGKSYVLHAYLRDRYLKGEISNVVFLVPTRALINQVSAEVASWLGHISDHGELVTTPIPADSSVPERAVYILTQERLQLLLAAHEKLQFDLIAVDEAQSIGDGPRGVLLASVIEAALHRKPHCQILFAAPNIREPELLGNIFGILPKAVKSSASAVGQNVIFVDCDNTATDKAMLSVKIENSKIPIGAIILDQSLHDHRDKLINIPLALGAKGQSLVYALGPAECENIAFGIADGSPGTTSAELRGLSDFIKEAVHSKFQLATTVLKGVGFHYGRLPSLVRKNVEDMFSEGHLRYLVTTSTLLYGVNLPARNLFLHNPRKGKDTPISSTDFWNLAGRAGRLGKEFSGNIFLIDYDSWPNPPMEGDREKSVVPALKEHVLNQTEGLIGYMGDPEYAPDRDGQDEFENTFVKLFRDHLNGRAAITLERLGLSKDDHRHRALLTALSDVKEATILPARVFESSPTVSIHRQQALYDWIVKSLKKHGPDYVIPKHPLADNAYKSLATAFKRCHGAILKLPRQDDSHWYFATIALRWMKGNPLPQIIDAAYDYKRKKNLNPNIATVIRDTLSDIENRLRFRYVRLMSCYTTVLQYALVESNNSDHLGRIPAYPLYLEVGACNATMVSFMSIGLSRFTANKLRTVPRRAGMSQVEARQWIRSQDIEALDLPRASIDEIRRIVV